MTNLNNGARYYLEQKKSDKYLQVQKYAPLVKRIALHLVKRLPASVEADDLIQAGMLGLLDALERYEPVFGASFETYASIRIRGSMIDDLRRVDWAPHSVHANTRLVNKTRSDMSHKLGRNPTDTELAKELNITTHELVLMEKDSVNCIVPGISDLGVSDDVITGVGGGEDNLPFSVLSADEFKQSLAKAIEELPEKEKQILSLYYNDEMNLKEIGMIYNVSESRTSQIISKATARLREALSEWTGKEN